MAQNTGITAESRSTSLGRGGNGLAIAGLVCGLVGLLLFPVILGPLALIFGLIALARAKRGAGHRGMALAAVVLGVVDILIFVVLVIAAARNGGSISYHLG